VKRYCLCFLSSGFFVVLLFCCLLYLPLFLRGMYFSRSENANLTYQ